MGKKTYWAICLAVLIGWAIFGYESVYGCALTQRALGVKTYHDMVEYYTTKSIVGAEPLFYEAVLDTAIPVSEVYIESRPAIVSEFGVDRVFVGGGFGAASLSCRRAVACQKQGAVACTCGCCEDGVCRCDDCTCGCYVCTIARQVRFQRQLERYAEEGLIKGGIDDGECGCDGGGSGDKLAIEPEVIIAD